MVLHSYRNPNGQGSLLSSGDPALSSLQETRQNRKMIFFS